MSFTPEDNLRLAIRFGLVKGLHIVRGLRRQLDEDDRNRIAEAIREHDGNWLKANGVNIENKGAKITFTNGVRVNYIQSDQDATPAPRDEQAGTNGAAARSGH